MCRAGQHLAAGAGSRAFARGLGPAPAFPGPVSIAVGEEEYVDLTAAEAADPANWVLCEDGECHSALAALAQILTTPVEMDDFYAQTFLVVTDDLPSNPAMDTFAQCLTPRSSFPEGFPTTARPTSTSTTRSDGGRASCPPPPVLQIGWTEGHEIASVRLRLAATDAAEVVDPTEPTAERQASAEEFVAWARGEGPAPAFADRVRVMFGGGGHSARRAGRTPRRSRAAMAAAPALASPSAASTRWP